MTQDEIIEMAKEVEFEYWWNSDNKSIEVFRMLLKRFANLVAAKEREACANLCDELPAPNVYSDSDKGMWDIASLACGDAIRARGEQA